MEMTWMKMTWEDDYGLDGLGWRRLYGDLGISKTNLKTNDIRKTINVIRSQCYHK